MDIIAVQMASKVLKKMNTEYAGIYETQTATAGQTVFTTTNACSIQGHILDVYVDGFLAYESKDYTLGKTVDEKAVVTFTKPLEADSIVLLATDIVGVPRIEVINPDYNDSELRTKVSDLTSTISTLGNTVDTNTQAIADIKTVLDGDSDGSIIDALTDLKTQWESADGSLITLINDKASQTSVTAIEEEIAAARGVSLDLVTELSSIKSSIPEAYNDVALTGRVTNVESDITSIGNTLVNQSNAINDLQASISSIPAPYDDTSLKQRVSTIEGKSLTDFVITDTVNNWPYKLVVANGSLSVELLHNLSLVTLNRETTGDVIIGDTLQLLASSTFSDGSDATSTTIFVYSVDDTNIATVDSVTGILTAVAPGDVTITLQGTAYGVSRQATLIVTILDTPTP